MDNSYNIVVKAVFDPLFEISMVQDINGRYRVEFGRGEAIEFSEWIVDYKMASFMFDMKLQELEGH